MLGKETVQESERTSHCRDFSAAGIELLSEALKMRRCTGILIADHREPVDPEKRPHPQCIFARASAS